MSLTVKCKECGNTLGMGLCKTCKEYTYNIPKAMTITNSIDEKFKQEVLSYLANIYGVTRMTQDRLERKEDQEVLVTSLIEIIDRYRNQYYSNSTIAAKIREKFRIYKR